MQSITDEESSISYYERVHLRGLPDSAGSLEKIKYLQNRSVKKLYHSIFNILAILFFAYLHVSEFAVFEKWVTTALIIIFFINTGLILHQRKQIHELLEFHQEK